MRFKFGILKMHLLFLLLGQRLFGVHFFAVPKKENLLNI